jgi:hypothetical protein
VDIETGKLEWLVNGYQFFQTASTAHTLDRQATEASATAGPLAGFNIGEMKFPETKIGEGNPTATQWMSELHVMESQTGEQPPNVEPSPKPIPLPPRIRPRPNLQKARK